MQGTVHISKKAVLKNRRKIPPAANDVYGIIRRLFHHLRVNSLVQAKIIIAKKRLLRRRYAKLQQSSAVGILRHHIGIEIIDRGSGIEKPPEIPPLCAAVSRQINHHRQQKSKQQKPCRQTVFFQLIGRKRRFFLPP